MRVLVSGGAGYIGAHVVRLLLARGDEVLVVDDLSTGVAERVTDASLVVDDVARPGADVALALAMAEHRCEAVIHLAALKQVDESVAEPVRYYRQNLGGFANVLDAAERVGVRRVVFSSSAAVYASADHPLREDETLMPANPYGETKLAGEWLLDGHVRATGGRAISLRYFNVAGAASPDLGDTAALNLVPMVFERIERGEAPRVFGTDYPTPDGSCIRDYIHVQDLARAHLDALDALDALDEPHRRYNVGTGTGTSVLEMVQRMLVIAGSDLDAVIEGRRPGDPAMIVADSSRIRAELGWTAHYGTDEILRSAWAARRAG